jgi:pimeloyl-ACP methyl ester carboxylesterase
MQVHLESHGAGPCAVFVHGQGGDLRSWDRLWPLLPSGRRCIRYDLRDFGGSVAKSHREFTHSQDLSELLHTMSIGQCDLVGVSMGGGIALSFALDHPARVRSLVLVSPQIGGWEWSQPWHQRWHPIVDAARSGRLREAKQLWWDHPMFASTRETDAADALRDEIERFAGRQWIGDSHALIMPDVERLHELRSSSPPNSPSSTPPAAGPHRRKSTTPRRPTNSKDNPAARDSPSSSPSRFFNRFPRTDMCAVDRTCLSSIDPKDKYLAPTKGHDDNVRANIIGRCRVQLAQNIVPPGRRSPIQWKCRGFH